jgi:chemotaxis receptor (MCP) glutamine deamidase CheD
VATGKDPILEGLGMAHLALDTAVHAKSQMSPSPRYDDATMQVLIEYFKSFLPESKR